LNIIVVIFSLTGIPHSKYDKKGEIKNKVPLMGILSTTLMIGLILTFFFTFDSFAFKNEDQVNKNDYSLDSIKTHVTKQFTMAWIIKIPLLLMSSFCFYIGHNLRL